MKWKLAKISRPPEGQSGSAAKPLRPDGKRHRWYHRPRLDWHTPVTLRVRLVGGASCMIEVRARGGSALYDGGEALVDVLAQVLNQQRPERDL